MERPRRLYQLQAAGATAFEVRNPGRLGHPPFRSDPLSTRTVRRTSNRRIGVDLRRRLPRVIVPVACVTKPIPRSFDPRTAASDEEVGVLSALRERRWHEELADCSSVPGRIVPADERCRLPHYEDTQLLCQLPSRHAGHHEAELAPGRVMRWSVLDPG